MSIIAKVSFIAGIIALLPATVVCVDNMENVGGLVFIGACILIGSGAIAQAICRKD